MFASNTEWEMVASERLAKIATRYLAGEHVSREERAIITMVMAEIGSPPEAPRINDDPIPFMVFEAPEPTHDNSPFGYGNSGTW